MGGQQELSSFSALFAVWNSRRGCQGSQPDHTWDCWGSWTRALQAWWAQPWGWGDRLEPREMQWLTEQGPFKTKSLNCFFFSFQFLIKVSFKILVSLC